MIKVLWISNAPAPYKVSFMQELGKYCELTCFFETRAESDRQPEWYNYEESNFKAVYAQKNGNFALVRKLARENDLLINSDYSKLLCQYAVRQFHHYGKKTILHADGGLAIPRGLFDRVISAVMRQNDYVLSSGSVTDEYFRYYGIPSQKIRHYSFACASKEELEHNAVMRAERREECRRTAGYTEEIVLLGIGQMIPRKGFDVLLKAIAFMPENVGVYLVGGEPDEKIVELARPYAHRVHFVPFKSKKELEFYYGGADLFVLPTRYDIWGLVINEAMSFGLPWISTDHCVAALHFEALNGGGKIVSSGDERRLGECVKELCLNEGLRKTMTQDALQAIQSYHYTQMAKDFCTLFKEIETH